MMIPDYCNGKMPTAWRFVCQVCMVVMLGWLGASNAHSAPKTVLVVGDSLSAEYGLPAGSGWVALLDKRLKAEKIGARFINASISGDTTSGGKSRLPSLLQKHRPAVVIIELGGNDALRGLPLSVIEGNLRAMILVARKAHAKVLLTGMQIPPNYGAAYANGFAAMYARLARETHSALVPFLLEGVAQRDDLFQPDRIHPTAQAQPLIAVNVWLSLKSLLR